MKVFNLSVNEQEMQAILDALAERPFKVAQPVIVSLDSQIRAQFEKAEKESAEAHKEMAESKPENEG